jgi:hypothetical protein
MSVGARRAPQQVGLLRGGDSPHLELNLRGG